MTPNLDPRFGAFYILTFGVFMTFASGMGVCMFNLDTVDACAAYASSWVSVFQAMGDHIIAWGIALCKAAFKV